MDISIHKTSRVISDECHACLKCVSACPEKDAIYISASKFAPKVKPWIYAAAICLIFLGGSTLGRVTGHWQTSISINEYRTPLSMQQYYDLILLRPGGTCSADMYLHLKNIMNL